MKEELNELSHLKDTILRISNLRSDYKFTDDDDFLLRSYLSRYENDGASTIIKFIEYKGLKTSYKKYW